MATYDTVPETAQLRPQIYHLEVPDQDISDFKDLLRLSKLAPKTYENTQIENNYGVTHEWMAKAKEHWLTKYDWYVCDSNWVCSAAWWDTYYS